MQHSTVVLVLFIQLQHLRVNLPFIFVRAIRKTYIAQLKSGNGSIFLRSSFFIHLPFHLSSSGDLHFLFFVFLLELQSSCPKHPYTYNSAIVLLSKFQRYRFYFARSCNGNPAYVSNWKSAVEVNEQPVQTPVGYNNNPVLLRRFFILFKKKFSISCYSLINADVMAASDLHGKKNCVGCLYFAPIVSKSLGASSEETHSSPVSGDAGRQAVALIKGPDLSLTSCG